jgi:hypothetical protein
VDKKLSRLTTEQRYELVAYLDGELDDGATARVEKLIAENPVARQDVELLAATYKLMDALPRPKATSDFSEKTMAMARLEDVRPDVTQSPLYRRSQKAIGYFGWIAAMCVAGAIGYSATRFWVAQPHDDLVRDLDTIEELDKFSEVGSIDFLGQSRADGRDPRRGTCESGPVTAQLPSPQDWRWPCCAARSCCAATRPKNRGWLSIAGRSRK